MSSSSKLQSGSDAARRMAELAARRAEGGAKRNVGEVALARTRPLDLFEVAASSRALKGPNLTGESQGVSQLLQQTVTPQPPAQQGSPEIGPFVPLELPVASHGIPLGTVSHQQGTIYSDNVAEVLSGENPEANYCASTAFSGIDAVLPDWAQGTAIHDVLETYNTSSSVEVWDQLVAQLPTGQDGKPVGVIPVPQQVTATVLPERLPIALVGEGGEALHFVATEMHTRYDPGTVLRGGPSLVTLADMEVGEVRAVIMRPLDNAGNSVDGETGHWVMVERTEDGYRLTQSAPENWALLGGSAQTLNGGVYQQDFTGETALADLSNYIHAEAQYSTDTGMYGLVVLEPTVP